APQRALTGTDGLGRLAVHLSPDEVDHVALAGIVGKQPALDDLLPAVHGEHREVLLEPIHAGPFREPRRRSLAIAHGLQSLAGRLVFVAASRVVKWTRFDFLMCWTAAQSALWNTLLRLLAT